jgi:membrane protease subunit HflC
VRVFDKVKEKLPKGLKFSWTAILVVGVILVLVFELLTGGGGCVEVHPGEVAVKYNNFSGDKEIVSQQGVKWFTPGLTAVHILSSKPQILVMGESKQQKKRKGFFESGTVNKVDIETSGSSDGYKQQVVVSHVREILRDEFGKFSFLEIADPTSYGTATTDARVRLNERLVPYGVTITQIITPKPKFDARVEKAIEDRQNSEQEVEVQVEKRNKLTQEKALKIQSVEQSKNVEFQSLVADLEARKKASSNKLLEVKREADKYFIDRQAAGAAYRDEKVTRAKANEVAYRKEAQALVAKIRSVGDMGPDVLNSVIAEKVIPQLKNVSATPLIMPSSPIDIRYLDGRRRSSGGDQ